MLPGSDDDVRMTLADYGCFSMSRGRPAAPERHRTPRGRKAVPRTPMV